MTMTLYSKMFLAAIFAGICLFSNETCADENSKMKEMINFLNDKVGRCPNPGNKESDMDTIREDKRPGDLFSHVFHMNIQGKASALTKRYIQWWKTKNTVRFFHETNLVIAEKITSTKDDLDNGIIKSKFDVQLFSENLISADLNVEFGKVSTKDFVPLIKEISKASPFLKKAGTTLFMTGLTFSSAVATLPEGLALSVAGGALHLIAWGADMVDKKSTQDGYIRISDKTLQERCPEYSSFVTKLRNYEGTEIEAVWECGKGYTSVKIRSDATDDEQELLAKLIYRSNPIAASELYPEELGERKVINAEKIGGMIFTHAVDYDRVTGIFTVKNRGTTTLNDDDIQDITSFAKTKDIRFAEIGIVENGTGGIKLVTKTDSTESISLMFIPHGKFYILRDVPNMPEFVKHAELTGEINAKINNKKGFLQEISIDERDAKVNVIYDQIYQGRPE